MNRSVPDFGQIEDAVAQRGPLTWPLTPGSQ